MIRAEALERARKWGPDKLLDTYYGIATLIMEVSDEAERRGALAELRRMARERCRYCKQDSPVNFGATGVAAWHDGHICDAQAEHRRIAELEAQG